MTAVVLAEVIVPNYLERPVAGGPYDLHRTGRWSPGADHRSAVKNEHTKIGFEDIRWLRRASGKSGSGSIPAVVAKRLVAAGLLEAGPRRSTMSLTDKGRIALSKLG
jgi:hypothetical protein